MNRKATLLNQLRKLQEKLERIHDTLNERHGPANELTQLSMHAFALAFASVCDAESILDEEDRQED